MSQKCLFLVIFETYFKSFLLIYPKIIVKNDSLNSYRVLAKINSTFAPKSGNNEKGRQTTSEQNDGQGRVSESRVSNSGKVREYVSAEREKDNGISDIAMLEEGMGAKRREPVSGNTARKNRHSEEEGKESLVQAAKMASKELSQSEIESLGEKIPEQTGESDVYVNVVTSIQYFVKICLQIDAGFIYKTWISLSKSQYITCKFCVNNA